MPNPHSRRALPAWSPAPLRAVVAEEIAATVREDDTLAEIHARFCACHARIAELEKTKLDKTSPWATERWCADRRVAARAARAALDGPRLALDECRADYKKGNYIREYS